MRRVETEQAASALADRLNGADRGRPVVVVTTSSGRREPWIDAREIERQVGDLAEVYLMPTGPFTWAFSTKMPPMTQVYGGAGRVYPVGHAWISDLRASPLRLAYTAKEGSRATDRLIDDAMSMAAIAGLHTDRRRGTRTRLDGTVARIVADRALVRLANGRLGNVSPGFAVPGLAIERVLSEGQPVSGWLDEANAWFDVREMIVPVDAALSSYAVGDVVLAEVGEVSEASSELFLHPLVPVRIGRDEVTGNDLDDLRTLMTRGEVVAARVVATEPIWRLSMLDVDDAEEPARAASLLRGGPPWLVPPVDDRIDAVPEVPPPPVLVPQAAARTQIPVAHQPQRTPAPGPSPRLLDPRRRRLEAASPPGAPVTASGPATSGPTPSGELGRALAEVEALRRELDGLRQEVQLLRHERATFESRNHHLERQLADQRSRLRKAKRPAPGAETDVAFADAEQGFRYDVLTAWARRTPVAEQAATPLPAYRIGPQFIDSLERLQGVSRLKVADVVFEIVTDRAKDLASRELHPYRESEGSGAKVVSRPEDGATLWRASLQSKTASARRIHFWRLPHDAIELVHVGLHDDRPPIV